MSDSEESNKHQQEKTHSLGSNQPRVIKRPITTDEINIVKGGAGILAHGRKGGQWSSPTYKRQFTVTWQKVQKSHTYTLIQ